ncbi:MAG TPA: cytochrome c biogenesis protein CcdA [Hyphomicrobiaceae bacterium]|nr:cytochrome c biogenesis protein CcdA [Hyphomicrobiaceae bacterium]
MLADLYIYFGIAFAGLLSFLSPCVLPLVPPYLSYLGGMSIEEMTADERIDRRAWRRVVLGACCFVLGFSTVFIGLGAGASMFGQLIQTYKYELSMVAGAVIILFGLHFLGLLHIPHLHADKRYRANMHGASYLGAYIIGLAFAFGWTPCIGPILAAVLTLAASEGSLGTGVRMLAAYSLGLGIPFVLAAVAIRPFLGFMQRFRGHLGKVEKVMGVLLILTGIAFLTGSITWIGQWLIDHVPFLAEIESWATPKDLQSEILKKGMGK